MRGRWLLAAVLLAVTGASASAAPSKRGGILRVGTTGASVQVDPQVAYVTTAWWLEYATAAKLYNYPDRREQAGAMLRPEVASGYTISRDGKTYTFTIRIGFRFSDGTPVTARNFAYAIDRAANHDLNSPAAAFITDPNGTNIAGAKAVSDGARRHVTGVRVRGNKLVVHLTRRDGTFMAKITMPFFQATSTKLPLTHEVTSGYPSAGPYYYSRNVVNQLTSIRRNPYWTQGPGRQRPRNLTGVDVRWNQNEETAFQEVLANDLDLGPLPASEVEHVAQRFGVNRTRFWSMPTTCVGYMQFNNAEGLFAGNPQMRRAVNWVLDRQAYLDQAGPYTGSPWTHLLGPATPGSITAKRRQPYAPGPDIARARRLAEGHFKDGRIIVLYLSSGTVNPSQSLLVKRDLIRLGFEPDNIIMRPYSPWPGPMEPQPKWDLWGTGFGWCQDYPDPYDILNLMLLGNQPYSLGPDADLYKKKLRAAAKLTGRARRRTYGELDLQIMREVAPLAPVRTYNNRTFFSNRVNPRSLVFQPVYADWSIPALALK